MKQIVVAAMLVACASSTTAQDLSRISPTAASAKVEASTQEDWPQFRGPDGQGHSLERGLPLEWGESRNVRWKSPIAGLGWSSPVVANGKVWLTSAVEQRGISLRAFAFDVETGKEVVNIEVFKIPTDRRDINPKNSWA